jgi:hypothetical protein
VNKAAVASEPADAPLPGKAALKAALAGFGILPDSPDGPVASPGAANASAAASHMRGHAGEIKKNTCFDHPSVARVTFEAGKPEFSPEYLRNLCGRRNQCL